MKEEELIKKLESVDIPSIELESHRSRLRMALLSSDYFKKKWGNKIVDAVRTQARGVIDTMLDGMVARRPVWKIALVSTFAMLMMAAMLFGLGSLTGLQQAGLNPGGYTETGGPQLTEAEKARAMDILVANPEIQALLVKGATISTVLPIYVVGSKINPETGVIEDFQETWAQAWITGLDNTTWGAQVDLVRGKVVSISD